MALRRWFGMDAQANMQPKKKGKKMDQQTQNNGCC